MAIKIYGTYYSPATNRALVVLHEKDVQFELVSTSVLEAEEKKPEYLALNPFGAVPLLQDGDDVQIFESRAIARYIADKYEQQGTPRLYGATLAERAQVEQWLDVEIGTFSVIMLTLIRETLYKPGFFKAPTDSKVVTEFTPKLTKVLDIYEAHLAKHKFLAGEFVSIADLAHLPFAWLYFEVCGKHEELLSSRKHLAAWWTAISSRPAWKQVLAIAGPDYEQWAQKAKAFTPS